jgi:acyl carrier protein
MDDIKATIRQFILSTYLPDEASENLRDDTPLQTSGILDSLALVSLASYIEQQFGVDLDVYATSAERFDSIADIVATIGRKLPVSAVGDQQ